MSYETIDGARAPIKAWTHGVPVEDEARKQLLQTADLPFVGPHVAVMPDVHWGMGSTVGSVVPTEGAIVPACVGVDLGCGMVAVRTNLDSRALGDNGQAVRDAIERSVPHGRTDNGGVNDRGAWGDAPTLVRGAWQGMLGDERCHRIIDALAKWDEARAVRQLGTLGTGNHFVEVCLDLEDRVWVMLHSGSRGIGNTIASHYIAIAKKRADADGLVLASRDLAWLPEGTPEFAAYVDAISWAQDYAKLNRDLMLASTVKALRETFPDVATDTEAVNCHHNYVSRERHFGRDLWITRKGAVSARLGELGIIPGAMGRRSFIVRGKGDSESFC